MFGADDWLVQMPHIPEWVMPTLAWGIVLFECTSRGTITRRIVRNIFRFFAVLEVCVLKLMRTVLPPKYALVGDCVRCGKCCQEIVSRPPRALHQGRGRTIFLAFHKIMHNFTAVGEGPDGEILFRCGHLQTDGSCGIHRWRPFLCRNFPMQPWFEPPRILPYCSYQVAARSVTKMTPRTSLRIVNAHVAVHHPSPEPGMLPTEQFHFVDVSR